jgi:hypothetical protein
MLKVNDVQLSDRIEVPTERVLTDAGQMHVPCKFARTGSQLYTAKQLGLVDREDNEVITVHREAADVFDSESMATFRSAPVTIGHPKSDDGKAIVVSAENAKELQVGMLEGMPVQDEETLGGVLVLTAQEAIDALEDGTQELSAGYTCDIEDVDGAYFQRNIRANHIAIVSKGRAGSSCRISDEALEVQAISDEALEVQAIEDGAIEAQVAQAKAEAAEQEKKEAKAAEERADRIAAKAAKKEKAAAAKEAALAEKAKAAEAEKVAAEAEEVSEVKSEEPNPKVEDEAIDLTDELATAKSELSIALEDAAAQVALVDELKAELVDAKLAAEQSVTERCAAIENARLISDFRDLGDKTIEQIERMVVEDQMPEKDLSGKSDVFISAMFEILVDASKGETPMGKLLRAQNIVDATPVAKPVSKVASARERSIARSKA